MEGEEARNKVIKESVYVCVYVRESERVCMSVSVCECECECVQEEGNS